MVIPSKSPLIILSNGAKIPQLGLGTWQAKPGQVEDAVYFALTQAGYRHIDCAHLYANEKEIGEALKQAFASGELKREDVWITSKVWNTFHSRDMVLKSCETSLQDLGLKYLDLLLIHWPMGFQEGGPLMPTDPDGKRIYSDVDYLETWRGMEDCAKKGLVKSIGLSNFNSEQVQRVLDNCSIRPVMNQFEVHPYLTNENLVNFCQEKGIAVTAYCPLGSPSQPWVTAGEASISELPSVKEIAKNHNKTSAQVLLRFAIQRGLVVIPKSVDKSRIQENIDIFDFELDENEMRTIFSLNRNWRTVPLNNLKDHKYFPFGIPY